MPRRSGATCRPPPSTTVSPIRISPRSGRTNPATARSRVVLPQPDGPSTAATAPLAHLEVDPAEHGEVPRG